MRGSVFRIAFIIFAKVDFQNDVLKIIFKCESLELKTDLTKRPCYFVEPYIFSVFFVINGTFFY